MDGTERLSRFALLCGQCAAAARSCSSILTHHRNGRSSSPTTSRLQMSAGQFAVLLEEARSSRLDETVAELIAR